MIEHIRFNLTAAARRVGTSPPKFILSVLLVPDWKKEENGYNNPDYLQTHKLFFKEFKEALKIKSEQEKNGFELSVPDKTFNLLKKLAQRCEPRKSAGRGA